jgi:hypothetical protein
MFLAVPPLLIAAFCVFQAFAAVEDPDPQNRRVYWLFDGIVGMASLAGACGLLWRRRSNVQDMNP